MLKIKNVVFVSPRNNSLGLCSVRCWYQGYSSYKAPLLPCGGELTPPLQEARGAAAVRAGCTAPALERNHR